MNLFDISYDTTSAKEFNIALSNGLGTNKFVYRMTAIEQDISNMHDIVIPEAPKLAEYDKDLFNYKKLTDAIQSDNNAMKLISVRPLKKLLEKPLFDQMITGEYVFMYLNRDMGSQGTSLKKFTEDRIFRALQC